MRWRRNQEVRTRPSRSRASPRPFTARLRTGVAPPSSNSAKLQATARSFTPATRASCSATAPKRTPSSFSRPMPSPVSSSGSPTNYSGSARASGQAYKLGTAAGDLDAHAAVFFRLQEVAFPFASSLDVDASRQPTGVAASGLWAGDHRVERRGPDDERLCLSRTRSRAHEEEVISARRSEARGPWAVGRSASVRFRILAPSNDFAPLRTVRFRIVPASLTTRAGTSARPTKPVARVGRRTRRLTCRLRKQSNNRGHCARAVARESVQTAYLSDVTRRSMRATTSSRCSFHIPGVTRITFQPRRRQNRGP